MRIPNFQEIEEMYRKGDHSCHSYAKPMHPNPKFYKYYWWIFWRKSPVDGREFLTDKYRLPTKAAMQLVTNLKKQKEPCWIYNKHLPRLDPSNTPFDSQSPRWQGVEWAPAYDEDQDPSWRGHK